MTAQIIFDMFSGQIELETIENVMIAYDNVFDLVVDHLVSMRNDLKTTLISPNNPNSKKLSNIGTSGSSTVMKNKEAAALVQKYVSNKHKLLVLIRGCPGSGKTTLAKKLRMEGVMFSTDDEISANNCALSVAHCVVEEKAEEAMRQSKNPIIIESTNVTKKEMLPYVKLANTHGYVVQVMEADVTWRLQPKVLANKSSRKIKANYIEQMLKDYEFNITGNDLLEVCKSETRAPTSDKKVTKSEGKKCIPCCSSSVSINVKSLFSDKNTKYIGNTDNSENLKQLRLSYPSMDSKLIKTLFIECGHKLDIITAILNDVGHNYLLSPSQYKNANNNDSVTISDLNKMNENKEPAAVNPSTEQGNMWSTKIKVKQLEEKFPSIDKTILKNIFTESGYKMDVTVKAVESTLEMLAQSEKTDESAGELEICLFNKLKELSLDHCEKASLTDQSYLELVEKISKFEKLYEESIIKSRQYFNKKKYSSAHVYATKVQILNKKLSEHRRLCSEILVQNTINSASRFGSIDLHGLTKQEAMDLTAQFFSIYCKDVSQISSRSHIFISTGSSSLVKSSVENYLKKNSLEFTKTSQDAFKVKLNDN